MISSAGEGSKYNLSTPSIPITAKQSNMSASTMTIETRGMRVSIFSTIEVKKLNVIIFTIPMTIRMKKLIACIFPVPMTKPRVS